MSHAQCCQRRYTGHEILHYLYFLFCLPAHFGALVQEDAETLSHSEVHVVRDLYHT
jgi:hypothetical protein